ncbi:MAG: hypothetical protein MH252_15390 [Thermosynechococcaceae cyanobacterium MS004]|nr:hypothetical protein [Thermosynechococcaceae cyanobacterium MS004]
MQDTDCRKVNEAVKPIACMIFAQLRQLRQTIYDCCSNAKDALCELMDTVLCTPSLDA